MSRKPREGGTDAIDIWFEAVESNTETAERFIESLLDSTKFANQSSSDTVVEGMEGWREAQDVWMEAVERQSELTRDAVEGGDISPEDFRDIWLKTANQSFKKLMDTQAFASAAGETLDETLKTKKQADEAADELLHSMGFATKKDIREVGERLAELERRQHTIENKLDQLLDQLLDQQSNTSTDKNQTAAKTRNIDTKTINHQDTDTEKDTNHENTDAGENTNRREDTDTEDMSGLGEGS